MSRHSIGKGLGPGATPHWVSTEGDRRTIPTGERYPGESRRERRRREREMRKARRSK